MLSRALPSRARLLLLQPHSRSVFHGPVLGLRGLSSQAAVAAPYGYGEHHHQRDEQDRAVKVTVWWDFQLCRVPSGVSPLRLASRVTAALRGAGIRGPVEINAFGDVTVLRPDEQQALGATGVSLSHVPFSGKSSCDLFFMTDLMNWIAQNPPPAHFFLISGDKEFANILHRLRMSNYNILVSCPEVGSKSLRSAATIMWPWEALVRGVNLTPKHVNQPPDGLSSSWYGDYKGPVDIQLLKSKDFKALPQKNTKIPQVPKSVVKGIKKVLRFYPEGISLPNLRAELKRANVSLDTSIFGFRKFSALLQAMPDVVKFIDPLPGDSQPAVVGIFKGSVEPSEQDFNGMDSTQSSIEEKHPSETESEELSSWVSQSSSSELSSYTKKKNLEADVPSSAPDQLSSGQRITPDLTTRAEPHFNRVKADISPAADLPSSDALSRDQRNDQGVDLVTRTETPIDRTEADIASGAPRTKGQGNTVKKGLLGRILSLWNGAAH